MPQRLAPILNAYPELSIIFACLFVGMILVFTASDYFKKPTDKQRVDAAIKTLHSHGFTVNLYVPSATETERNPEVAAALRDLDNSGFIVLGSAGQSIGKIVPMVGPAEQLSMVAVPTAPPGCQS